MQTKFDFLLNIANEEYLRYYRGSAHNVLVMTWQGKKVQFPASALRPFVTNKGIQGHFVLVMDENNKLVELRKV